MAQQIDLLYGPPGSGKTTLMEQLQREGLAFDYVSIGDAYRKEGLARTALSRRLEAYVTTVREYPRCLIERLAQKALGSCESEVVVFDGFPKYSREVPALQAILEGERYVRGNVYVLPGSYEKTLRHIQERRLCADCSSQVHNSPVCPACGGTSLIKRDDDEVDIFKRRHRDYEVSAGTVIPILEEMGYHTIRPDEDTAKNDISESIQHALTDIKEHARVAQ